MKTPLLLLLSLFPALSAAAGLPPTVSLPATVHVNADTLVEEDYGEAAMPVDESDPPAVQRGRHWRAEMTEEGLAEEATGADAWSPIQASLTASGWKVVKRFDLNPLSVTLRLEKGGKTSWAGFSVFGADDIRLDLIEVGASALKLTLPPPAAKPESISAEHGDFPYLLPLPGSTFTGGSADAVPMLVTLQGEDEPTAVGTGSIVKTYHVERVSNVQFTTTYRAALEAAGWTILNVSQGLGQTDAVIDARYAKGARDLWAELHLGGDEYSIRVADAGRRDLAAELSKDCRVVLTGVLFDFNESSLQGGSEPVLSRAAAALVANPKLAIEVGGHTDSVGGDDFNAKLSEARAASVVAWLVAHGVPAAQLTPKGYGRTQPIASNDTPEGRAQNRRVELTCRK